MFLIIIRNLPRTNISDVSAIPSEIKRECYVCTIIHCVMICHHHQPINVPTAGAQALLMDYT
jgi:hypothetical protein